MIHIEITNFQTIAHLKIAIDGFCTLIGKNFIGKSAVLRAINAALTNASGTSFIRWGEKYCEVSIKSNKSDILWHKEQNNNYYVINGTKYDKVGKDSSLPFKALNSLGFGQNDVGNETINLLYASQFNSIFLVDKRDAKSTDLLTAVYGLDRLYKAIDLCNKDQKNSNDILKLRKKDLEKYSEDLSRFVNFDNVLELKNSIISQNKDLCIVNSELSKIDAYISKATELSLKIKELSNIKNIDIPDNKPLKKLIDDLYKIIIYSEKIQVLDIDIKNLSSINNIEIDTKAYKNISFTIKDINVIDNFINRYNTIIGDIKKLSYVENIKVLEREEYDYNSINYIDSAINKINIIKAEYLKYTKDLKKVQKELDAISEEKKKFNGICPLCKNKLKED